MQKRWREHDTIHDTKLPTKNWPHWETMNDNSPRDELNIHSFSIGLTRGRGHFFAKACFSHFWWSAKSFKNPPLSRTACRPSYASCETFLARPEIIRDCKNHLQITTLTISRKKRFQTIFSLFQLYSILSSLKLATYVTARDHMHQ